MKLPDILTLSRFVMALLLIACLSFAQYAAALILFIFAAITDALDGHLARTIYGCSDFGSLLDPLADKVLTAAAFIGFVELGVMPAWMVVLILSREMMVTGLRLLAAEKSVVIAANRWGKQKTIWQMAYIIAVLFALTFGFFDTLRVLFSLFAIAVTALTVWSGFVYFRQNYTLIHNRN